MARRGLGLALAYRSCMESARKVEHLSIGEERCYVDLVLMYPPEGYSSRAIRALEGMVRQHVAEVN